MKYIPLVVFPDLVVTCRRKLYWFGTREKLGWETRVSLKKIPRKKHSLLYSSVQFCFLRILTETSQLVVITFVSVEFYSGIANLFFTLLLHIQDTPHILHVSLPILVAWTTQTCKACLHFDSALEKRQVSSCSSNSSLAVVFHLFLQVKARRFATRGEKHQGFCSF